MNRSYAYLPQSFVPGRGVLPRYQPARRRDLGGRSKQLTTPAGGTNIQSSSRGFGRMETSRRLARPGTSRNRRRSQPSSAVRNRARTGPADGSGTGTTSRSCSKLRPTTLRSAWIQSGTIRSAAGLRSLASALWAGTAELSTRTTELSRKDPAPYGPMAPQASVPPQLSVPAGTFITVRVNQFLSSDRNGQGDPFSASLVQPLVVNGVVVAEPGQTIAGQSG